MNFKRARNDNQVELRKQEILDAYKQLLLEVGYDDTTLLSVSKLISVGRTTIYNYFPTKEDMFMELCIQEGSYFINDMKEAYEKADNNNPYKSFEDAMMKLFIDYKHIFDYYAIYVAKVMGKASKDVIKVFSEKISIPIKDLYKKWLLLLNPNLDDKKISDLSNVLLVFLTGIHNMSKDEDRYYNTCKTFVQGTILIVKK